MDSNSKTVKSLFLKKIMIIAVGVIVVLILLLLVKQTLVAAVDHRSIDYDELQQETDLVETKVSYSMDTFLDNINFYGEKGESMNSLYTDSYNNAKEGCDKGYEDDCEDLQTMEYETDIALIVEEANIALEEITIVIDEFSKLGPIDKELEDWFNASVAYFDSMIVFLNDIITSLGAYGATLEISEYDAYKEDISDSKDAMSELQEDQNYAWKMIKNE